MRSRGITKSKAEPPNVISLFSGAGGMDIGFENAGFNIAVAVEFDSSCCNTLRANKPNLKVIEGDISSITTEEILKAANLKPLEVGLVIGGPPCQSFSLAGSDWAWMSQGEGCSLSSSAL